MYCISIWTLFEEEEVGTHLYVFGSLYKKKPVMYNMLFKVDQWQDIVWTDVLKISKAQLDSRIC